MSLDYPNRADWLAVRAAQSAMLPVSYFWLPLKAFSYQGRQATKMESYSVGRRRFKEITWAAKLARAAGKKRSK